MTTVMMMELLTLIDRPQRRDKLNVLLVGLNVLVKLVLGDRSCRLAFLVEIALSAYYLGGCNGLLDRITGLLLLIFVCILEMEF